MENKKADSTKTKQGLIKNWSLRGLVVALVAILISVSTVYYLMAKPMDINEETVFDIKAGSGSGRITWQLVDADWGLSTAVVKLAIKLHPNWVPKVGKYRIEPGMSLLDALALFDSGKSIRYYITLVEGKTVKDYLLKMQETGNIEMTLFGLSNEEIAKKLNLSVSHAEGQFFADTYSYQDGNTDADILLHAHKKLQSVLDQYWPLRKEGLPLKSAQEALILASIVEKETGDESERPLIAGVFINRLNKHMRLQTDPTVIYGLGDSFDGNIRRSHLRQNTPYNTYTNYGLPPTPIANVGEEAIKAALNPDDTKALYFVAKGDGTHEFSNTLRQHNAAVAKYQRFHRRKDYQSTPTTVITETE